MIKVNIISYTDCYYFFFSLSLSLSTKQYILTEMSSSPDGRKAPPPRLKIQLPLPGQYYPQTGMGYVSTPYGQTPMPMTPVSGQPQMLYANKASEFVFSQFKGIKDLTKSGLSVGEKSAFWLYEKVCVISCVFLICESGLGPH